ncbi:MAG: hypothetical protein ACLT4Y_09080 [Bifidobacterium breve]
MQNVRDFDRSSTPSGRMEASIFLTGSNSYLLSGDLVTKPTGRYVETGMFTLSYSNIYMRNSRIAADVRHCFFAISDERRFPAFRVIDDEQARSAHPRRCRPDL